jgi:hypothetical protein
MNGVQFSVQERMMARVVAERMAAERGGELRSIAHLEAFLTDPRLAYLSLSTKQGRSGGEADTPSIQPSLRIAREEFWSAWQTEICARPDLIQRDTLDDALTIRANIHSTLARDITRANLADARLFAKAFISQQADSPARWPKTMVPLADKPFAIVYCHAENFIRNCHFESSVLAYALVVEGEGYFSLPRDGSWTTLVSGRGMLCVEPPGGIHAGQLAHGDLLAVIMPVQPKREGRLGPVLAANFEGSAPVTVLYEDAQLGSYSYLLRLKPGDRLPSLVPGSYFIYEAPAGCSLVGGEALGPLQAALRKDDVVAFSEAETGRMLSLEATREPITVWAVVRQPLPEVWVR